MLPSWQGLHQNPSDESAALQFQLWQSLLQLLLLQQSRRKMFKEQLTL
jgi:hypothetical protein